MPDLTAARGALRRAALAAACLFTSTTVALADSLGGGTTAAGLLGEYFANNNLTGSPAFVRREVRLDFDWGTVRPVGGSIAAPYAAFPLDNFSVRYTGQVLPAFSETYTLKLVVDDGGRLFIKPAGGSTWTTLIDQWNTSGTYTASYAMTAGQAYDVRVEYRDLSGAATLRLLWSAPSVPEEVVDTVTQLGFNNDGSMGSAFADIVKCARNGWEGVDGAPKPALDADGWPQADAAYVFQESLNQGLGIDPLMRGTITFSFTGRGTVSLFGNMDQSTLVQSYNSATNTTTGSFRTEDRGVNASSVTIRDTDRDGQLPVRRNGITNLRLMRPTAPDATTSYANDVLFIPQYREAMMNYFTALRVDLNNANQERFWSDRTRPSYFNQANGRGLPAVYLPNYGESYGSGASWEHRILLANETGRDLYINVPVMASGWTAADTQSYIYKLAQTIRYGSDGTEPYTAPTANPVYPPLNPNLRVYVEVSNEVWNFFSDAFRQYGDLGNMIRADADAHLGFGSTDPLARPTDFPVYNYDNLPTTRNPDGSYASEGTWRFRKHILRIVQISDIFRAVWGDANMHTRVRPVYEWQYADDNGTASGPLKFIDDWFNNGNGNTNVATPRPPSYYLWGGGGASYYGAANGYGVTNQLVNSGFDAVAVGNGYTAAPSGHTWSFTGTAGIARDAGAGDDIPPPFNGAQTAYIDGTGALQITVTIPSSQTSNIYAFVFRSVQRVKTGAPLDANGNPIPDAQKVRLLVNGTPSNARSFNQPGDGFTPSAWNSAYPWESNVVFWTRGTAYYSSNTFTAAPGSTVTLRIEGTATAGNIAFLDDVRLASIDQMYADGFPGGGEALGQPAGSGYQNGLNVQGSWALAYGLRYITYEGGWSLGGDTGGSPMQNAAKFGDSRTAAVNVTALGMFHKAGGVLNTLGTYSQWPSWSEFFAQEGLLAIPTWPLMQGQLTSLSNLPPAPTNGVALPAVLRNANLALSRDNTSGTLSNRGWISWNVVAPRTGTYDVALVTTGSGSVRLQANHTTTITSGVAGGTLTGTVFLTKGIHGLRLQLTGGTATVTEVRVTIPGAPTASPTITSAVDGNTTVTVNWTSVSGATGYRLYYGTSSGIYTNDIDAGGATSRSVTGLVNGTPYFFAVAAYNASGLGLPSGEVRQIPQTDGAQTELASWDFLRSNVAGIVNGSAVSAPANGGSSRATATSVTRGPGFPANASYAPNGGGTLNANPPANPANLAAAKTDGTYFQFAVSPASGFRLALSSIRLMAYRQNDAGTLGLEYSTDGFATAGTLVGETPIVANGWTGAVHTFTTSGIPALQNVTGTVTFRAYIYALSGGYVDRGLGNVVGNNNDVEILGAFFSTGGPPAAPTGLAATPGDAQVALTWTASSGATSYTVKRATTSGGPYTTVQSGVTATSFTNTGLTNGTTYYYVVSASNAGGESANSAQVAATPQVGAPAAPTGLAATPGDAQVGLTWTASAGATSYTVKRATTSGGPYTTVQSGVTATSFTNTGLTNGTTYYYVVSASNAGGESANSAQVAATPASSGGGGTVTLARWDLLAAGSGTGAAATADVTATASGVSAGSLTRGAGFVGSAIQTGYTGGGFNTASSTNPADLAAARSGGHYIQWTLAPTSGNRISVANIALSVYRQGTVGTFTLEVSADGFATAGTVVGTLTPTGTEWQGLPIAFPMSGVALAQDTTSTLTFRLHVYALTSGYVDRGVGMVAGNNDDIAITGTVASAGTAPAAPTGLAATPGDAQVALTWTASSGATSYTVKRATTSGGPYTTVQSGVTATSFTNTGLTNGTTYSYVVSASNAFGESANSAQVAATPQVPPPAAPTGLVGTPGDGQAVLSWTASSGATSYSVLRATTSGGPYTQVVGGWLSTSYTNTGLANGTTYHFVVTATNAGGTSGNSAQVSVTPAAALPAAPTGLVATAGDAQVTLNWNAVSGATSYTVRRGTASGSYTVTTTGVTGTSTVVTGLTNGTAYYFAVAAVNAAGTGANSNEAAATPAAASATAGLTREWWTGIGGTAIADLTGNAAYPLAPTGTDTVSRAQAVGWAGSGAPGARKDYGDTYGQRLRGFVTAPATGAYVFWLASDDAAELWLSTDDNPGNRVRIAFVNTWNSWDYGLDVPQWLTNGESGGKSSNNTFTFNGGAAGVVTLTANRRYYIEVLHKEGGGGDHVTVGWNRPGESTAAPTEIIPGTVLTPYVQPTGSAARQYWTGITGTGVANLTGNANYPHNPTGRDTITSLRATNWANPAQTTNWADNYGQRVRALLVAPQTGTYTFWIASDDSSEVWLSPTDSPANRVRIAWVNGWTNATEWGKYTSQRSSNNTFTFNGGANGVISLTAGRHYYIEVIQKEGTGGDNLTVGWRKPSDGAGTTPAENVPGSVLRPYAN